MDQIFLNSTANSTVNSENSVAYTSVDPSEFFITTSFDESVNTTLPPTTNALDCTPSTSADVYFNLNECVPSVDDVMSITKEGE